MLDWVSENGPRSTSGDHATGNTSSTRRHLGVVAADGSVGTRLSVEMVVGFLVVPRLDAGGQVRRRAFSHNYKAHIHNKIQCKETYGNTTN